jgi:hypothetical protein
MACRQIRNPAALPPGKEPTLSIGQEAGWASESVWMLWRREKSYPWWEENPGRAVRSPSLYRQSYRGYNLDSETINTDTYIVHCDGYTHC